MSETKLEELAHTGRKEWPEHAGQNAVTLP